MAGLIAMWITISVLVLIVSTLVLTDRTARFDDPRERRIIGAVGLAAPLWPLSAVVLLLAGIFFTGRYLLRVVQGKA